MEGSMRNEKAFGRRGNFFINYNFSPNGKGSLTLGNGESGSLSFVSPGSGIPGEGGVSETIGPGLNKNYIGPTKSIGGLFKRLPEYITGFIPGSITHIPDPMGMIPIAVMVAGIGLALRENKRQ